MTPDEFKARAIEIVRDTPGHAAHRALDLLTNDVLRDLGFGEGVDIFERAVAGWHADGLPYPGGDHRRRLVLSFHLGGKVESKKRPRVDFRSGRVHTDAVSQAYERSVSWAAQAAFKGEPIAGPVRFEMLEYRAVPKSWSKRDREAALAGRIRPTSVPDLDNVEKIAMDALNGIAWRDDSQVVEKESAKLYGAPGLVVRVFALEGVE